MEADNGRRRRAFQRAADAMIRIARGGPAELSHEPLATAEGLPATEACCELATTRACACRRSYSCPTHGTTCIGSHD